MKIRDILESMAESLDKAELFEAVRVPSFLLDGSTVSVKRAKAASKALKMYIKSQHLSIDAYDGREGVL